MIFIYIFLLMTILSFANEIFGMESESSSQSSHASFQLHPLSPLRSPEAKSPCSLTTKKELLSYKYCQFFILCPYPSCPHVVRNKLHREIPIFLKSDLNLDKHPDRNSFSDGNLRRYVESNLQNPTHTELYSVTCSLCNKTIACPYYKGDLVKRLLSHMDKKHPDEDWAEDKVSHHVKKHSVKKEVAYRPSQQNNPTQFSIPCPHSSCSDEMRCIAREQIIFHLKIHFNSNKHPDENPFSDEHLKKKIEDNLPNPTRTELHSVTCPLCNQTLTSRSRETNLKPNLFNHIRKKHPNCDWTKAKTYDYVASNITNASATYLLRKCLQFSILCPYPGCFDTIRCITRPNLISQLKSHLSSGKHPNKKAFSDENLKQYIENDFQNPTCTELYSVTCPLCDKTLTYPRKGNHKPNLLRHMNKVHFGTGWTKERVDCHVKKTIVTKLAPYSCGKKNSQIPTHTQGYPNICLSGACSKKSAPLRASKQTVKMRQAGSVLSGLGLVKLKNFNARTESKKRGRTGDSQQSHAKRKRRKRKQ